MAGATAVSMPLELMPHPLDAGVTPKGGLNSLPQPSALSPGFRQHPSLAASTGTPLGAKGCPARPAPTSQRGSEALSGWRTTSPYVCVLQSAPWVSSHC